MRLNTIEGHIKGIKDMVNKNKSCEEVLLQISAVESAVNSLGKHVLKNHLNSCVKDSIANGDAGILENFNKILDKYLG